MATVLYLAPSEKVTFSDQGLTIRGRLPLKTVKG